MNKHLIWILGLVLITLTICGTILWINHNSWTVRFEMDDNTKEAIESIEYPIVTEEENHYHLFNTSTGKPHILDECAFLHNNGTIQEINCSFAVSGDQDG